MRTAAASKHTRTSRTTATRQPRKRRAAALLSRIGESIADYAELTATTRVYPFANPDYRDHLHGRFGVPGYRPGGFDDPF